MLRRSAIGGARGAGALMISLQPLRQNWHVLAMAVVVTTAAAATVSLLSPQTYRSDSAIRFSGANLGSPEGDADQARLAATNDVGIARRTLDVAGVPGLTVRDLREMTEFNTAPAGLLEIAVDDPDPDVAYALCRELTRQLRRDQRGKIENSASQPKAVTPRPLEASLLAVAAGLVVGIAAAMASGLTSGRPE